jgi:hypothetical protein
VAFPVRILLVVSLSPRPSIVVYTCSTVNSMQESLAAVQKASAQQGRCGRTFHQLNDIKQGNKKRGLLGWTLNPSIQGIVVDEVI